MWKKIWEKLSAFHLYRTSGSSVLVGIHNYIGGNFLEYCFEENMPQRVADLKKNLDAKSVEIVDLCIERIKYSPQWPPHWKTLTLVDSREILTDEEESMAAEFLARYKEFRKTYPLPIRSHAPDAFISHHGLVHLPERAKAYIAGKDVIDGGAYVGDSVLVLRHYRPKKIYSFEISPENVTLFSKTMKMNRVPPEEVELVIAGLSDESKRVRFDESGGLGANIYSEGTTDVRLMNIDSFVAERNLETGLIKLDIEGCESPAFRGAVETLRKDRPIVTTAIYHNPVDFFQLKPYLESLDLNYRWMIRRLSPASIRHMPMNHEAWWLCHVMPLAETNLIGYPAELDEA